MGPRWCRGPSPSKYSGDVLLSQGVSPQVPSALAGLTAVFGMGTGVAPPPWSPETVLSARARAGTTAVDQAPKGRPRERSIASTSKVVLQALGRLVPVG